MSNARRVEALEKKVAINTVIQHYRKVARDRFRFDLILFKNCLTINLVFYPNF